MGRLPTKADFPAHVALDIVSPENAAGQIPNVLILLHGFGNSHEPFASFARAMNLAETVCISVRAPMPLPPMLQLPGFHWGDDVVFNSSTGLADMDSGFSASTKMISEEVIIGTLLEQCGFKTRDIVLFGFGQGGCASLAVAKDLQERGKPDQRELGGVVSIGGPLPSDANSTVKEKVKTPVLICHGSSRSAITTGKANEIKNAFEKVEIQEWKRPQDSMPGNRDEMMPIMRFFARRLRSKKGVPPGAVELT